MPRLGRESKSDASLAGKPLQNRPKTFCNHNRKGSTVTPTEHSPKTPSPRTGIFALLWNPLGFGGSGAPKTPLRLFLSILIPALGALAFAAGPAFAGTPPEAPVTEAVTANTGTSVTFNGTLNPGVAPQAGTYEFLYKKGATGCAGESATPAGVMSGLPTQPVTEPVGVEPDTEYTVCLAATNPTPETTVGNAIPFTTKAIPPTIASLSASVKSTEATLDAQINPNNEATNYIFEYSQTEAAGKLTGTIVKVNGASPLENFGEQTASVSTGAVLTAATTYYYRVVAENAQSKVEGKPVVFPVSSVQSFTTVPTPATETPSPIGTTTATFNGKLTPLSSTVATEYAFDYDRGEEAICTNESATATVSAGTGTGAKAVSTAVTGLQPNQKYTVCLVAKNVLGAEQEDLKSPPAHFTTKPLPPEIESESTAVPVPSHEATFETTINPNNQATTYKVEYSTSATGETLKAPITTIEGASPLEGYPGQAVSVPTSTPLVQNTTYYYRVTAENAKGEKAVDGKVKSFTTAIETPEGEEANPVGTSTATLKGVLSPNATATGEAGTYEFVYRQSSTECEGGEHSEDKAAPVPSGTALGHEKEAVEAPVSGRLTGTQYTFCLVEHNAAGEMATGSPVTFTTHGPGITSEQAATVESEAATLKASIDPNESATTYHFEYDTSPYTSSAAHGTRIPATASEDKEIGAGTTPVPVEVRLTGLTPGTTYYYRVVATDEIETFYGPSKTLITPQPAGSEPSQECTNEKLRQEQPYGLALPDCRAYELVSPPATNGNDATSPRAEDAPRASNAEEQEAAITYAGKGSFGSPEGALVENQYLSRRTPHGWNTDAITALSSTGSKGATEDQEGTYPTPYFTPELTAGLAVTSARLGEAPSLGEAFGIYVAQFAPRAYQYIGPASSRQSPWGASTDLSRVVLTNTENESLLEWVDGTDVPVSVTNTGEEQPASAGSAQPNYQHGNEKDAWQATSDDASRVYFTTPANFELAQPGGGVGQLYVRVNVGQPQSPLADGEANGTGTLTAGSATVTSLVAAIGEASGEEPAAGATELKSVTTKSGRFAVGATISGPGIAVGTTITAVSGATLTLSTPTTATVSDQARIESSGPEPFVVGQGITGNGIPQGTTVAGVAPGVLTLSANAAASGTVVALVAGGECTVAADACTIEVSASQRFSHANPGGTQAARFWGASRDGSRVFFTSDAELTEDAYTGPDGDAANLYEYDLETRELTDLTGEAMDDTGEGAAVQGVVQVSGEGSYVYFVADGALAVGAVQGEPNLYVSHEGGAPVFIATLAEHGDITDWLDAGIENAGPEVNTAVVNPAGSQLAFISERSLPTVNFPKGYDAQQAQPNVGECETELETNEVESGMCREVYLYDAETGGLVCASCNPSGARPVGPANLPGVLFRTQPFASYRPRDLLAGGALFFDSRDALVSGAVGGQRNVYEFEGGGVHAVSNVAGGYESFFLDASPDGENAFFASADRLLPEDPGGNTVVYDARVDGGFPVAAPECTTAEACRNASPPTPYVFGPPPSATFSGPGNLGGGAPNPPPAMVKPKPKTAAQLKAEKLAKALKSCRKDKSKSKRTKCEKQAKAKYGSTKARKKAKAKKSDRATNDRRASR
jgi:hypothetical protein